MSIIHIVFYITIRFRKGTANQEILEGRVCEVIFGKSIENIEENGITGFKTTLTHTLNSIQKAGPSGSVTKKCCIRCSKNRSHRMVYRSSGYMSPFRMLLSFHRWRGAYVRSPGDFTKDRYYRVTAADGSTQDYILKTVKAF